MKNCPICGSELDVRVYNDESGRIEESYEKCLNGCYYNEFAYGNTRILIFGDDFSAHYTFDQQTWDSFYIELDNVIKYWKENDRYLMRIITNEN